MKTKQHLFQIIILAIALSLTIAGQVSASDLLQAGTVYTVRSSDTLSAIGRRFGVSYLAIKSANGLSSDTIYPGQRLIIPTRGTTTGAGSYVPSGPSASSSGSSAGSSCGSSYLVQRGDTLGGIAARCGVSIQAIKKANGLSSNTIYAGQRLSIPRSSNTSPPPQSFLPNRSVASRSPAPTPTPIVEPAFPIWRYDTSGTP